MFRLGLCLNERVMNSTAGAQQGDDLGPLLLATTMQEAKGHCESPTGCGGITVVGLHFQVHLESKTPPSMMGRCLTVVKGFAWCYKVGELLLRLSTTTHSSVLWVLLGARLRVVGFGQFHAQSLVVFELRSPCSQFGSTHHSRVLHNARVRSAAGQSLVARCRQPPEH